MPIIQTMTGSETLKDASSKVYVFHVPRMPSQRGWEETFLGKCATDSSKSHIIRKAGVPTSVQAIRGIQEEIGGRWMRQSYEVSDGEVLKIFAQRKRGWNALIESASKFIRIRETAPLRKLTVALLGKQECGVAEAEFVGRFDLLTLEEAAGYGVTVDPRFEHQFADVNTSVLFTDNVLEAETAPKQKIKVTVAVNEEGRKVATSVEVPRKPRKLEMD